MEYSTPKLWTALITPMTDNGEVDYPAIEKLVHEQNAAGNGILVLGSTGESLNLNKEEKQEIYKFVRQLDVRVPLMAGIGGINLQETLSDLAFLEELSYDCYLMVTPLYAKPGTRGQMEWFTTLMNNVSKPCMLYNIPGRTGISLCRKALEQLKDHKNFWSIKEASGSTKEFHEYVTTVSPAPVFSGDDGMLPEYAKIGARGLVSVASNAWPIQTNKYVEKTLEGSLTNSGDWKRWSDSLFIASNPIPVKRLMFEAGTIASPNCRAPLTHEEIQDSNLLKEINSSVNMWS